MAVAERLKGWRKAAQLTQQQAAKAVGVSQPAWSAYEAVELGPRGVDARIAHGIVTATAGTEFAVTLEMLADLCESRRPSKTKKKTGAPHRHRDNAPRREKRKAAARSAVAA